MPETDWTSLRQVDPNTPAGRRALDRFCRAYRAPVLAYVRTTGDPNPDDSTQAFFASLIDGGLERSVPKVTGRFRNYLHGAIHNFVNRQRRDAAAQKRGGGLEAVEFDEADLVSDPDEAFNASWAQLILNQAQAYQERGIIGAEEERRYQALRAFIHTTPAKGEYARVAQDLGITVDLVRTRVKRLRDNYRHAVRMVIANTVDNPADVEREMAELVIALGV